MADKLNVLIVDDEPLAREDLSSILGEFKQIKNMKEADSIESARSILQEFQPNVIFLDIKMPGESGFDLLPYVPAKTRVIFVTAYDEYAVRAFEVNAQDYLLKPVTSERMQQALEKFSTDSAEKKTELRKLDYDDRIFLLMDNHYQFLEISAIRVINAADDYTELQYEKDKKGLALKPMKEWEYRLPEKHFVRIHRSIIININHIDKIEKWFNHSFKVYVKNLPEPLVMSRRYSARIKEKYS